MQRVAEAVIIANVESVQDAGGGACIGRHIDLDCTALGKVAVMAPVPLHNVSFTVLNCLDSPLKP